MATAPQSDFKTIGTFQISSGQVLVSDPCYKKAYHEGSMKISGKLENVCSGEWQSAVFRNDETGGWGLRNHYLVAWLNNLPNSWTEEDSFCVGVDSGQAGIFDFERYPDGEDTDQSENYLARDTGEYQDLDSFYGQCCLITMENESNAGPVTYDGQTMGSVSSSGIGDGAYQCLTHRNEDGQIDGIKIVFIGYDHVN